jgi:hypothetical protein
VLAILIRAYVFVLCFLDRAQLDASLSTTNPFGASNAWSKYSRHTKRACGIGSQDLRVSRNHIHRCNGISESINNQAENRFEPVRKGIQGLFKAH